ncbi:MAG: hypothetical protein L0214_15145 [candidate division NC10 bacterium]|nr:hypothetical protein [candidate division NC10 bacterium]
MSPKVTPDRGFFLAVDDPPAGYRAEPPAETVHAWLDKPNWHPILGQWMGTRALKLGDLTQLAFGLEPGPQSLHYVTLQMLRISAIHPAPEGR